MLDFGALCQKMLCHVSMKIVISTLIVLEDIQVIVVVFHHLSNLLLCFAHEAANLLLLLFHDRHNIVHEKSTQHFNDGSGKPLRPILPFSSAQSLGKFHVLLYFI